MAADKSEPNNNVIAIYGVVTAIFLFLVTFGLMALYDAAFQKYEQKNRAEAVNKDLIALRSEENEKLHRYGIDPDTKHIQIPIERAMQLEAEKPWRPNAPWPTVTPTPVPPETPKPEEAVNPDVPNPPPSS